MQSGREPPQRSNAAVSSGVQRRGRPNLPDDVARRERVVTFVTEQEKASLNKLADSLSLSLSGVCHRLIAQALRCEDITKPKTNDHGAGS